MTKGIACRAAIYHRYFSLTTTIPLGGGETRRDPSQISKARPRPISPAGPVTKPNVKSAAASNSTQPAASTASCGQPQGLDNP
jgi:hypothetical protein